MAVELSEVEILFDRVLIKPDKTSESLDNGLITGEPKPPETGTVVAVGRGIQALETGVWIEMQVAVGDKVVFDRFSTSPFADTEYLLIEQGYIKSKLI